MNEMMSFLDSLKSGKTKKKTIAGADLKDDEAMLKLFSEIHDRYPEIFSRALALFKRHHGFRAR